MNLAQLPDGAILTPQQIMEIQRQRWEMLRWNAHVALRLQSGHDTGLLAYTRVKKYELGEGVVGVDELAPPPNKSQRKFLLSRGRR